MTYARILSTGSFLPERCLTNAELETMVETTDEWIRTRTGIEQRHLAQEGEMTSDLATRAAQKALEMAGVDAQTIDLIIVATTTPDKVFPSVATIVQRKLGIVNACPAFDVQAVCTGFVYALSIADQFIKTGAAKRALVIGAETLSRIVDWSDRTTCVLFGDGAGAVILEASNEPGILSTHLHADGRHEDLLHVPRSGLQAEGEWADAINMKGNEVFKVAVNTLGRIVDETLQANGLDQSAVDWLVPHQANLRIIMATAKKLNLTDDRVVITVQKHGNTSAASIPLALDTAVRDGRIQRGETLLLEAFGGGFTWGSVLVKF
jgi:3-oxoacyl-[acyl-carrier-protein] synthase-3